MDSRPTYVISATRTLNAPAKAVYDTIANYRTGHPRIVPRQFSELTVEQGGIGAGTIIRFKVTVLGQTTAFRAIVTEPEPGRVLVETNVAGSDGITTFTVDRGPSDRESIVTIRTEMKSRARLVGTIERFITSRVLAPIYEQELTLLEQAAAFP